MSEQGKAFINGLSHEQRRAACETENPAMVIACAGSGKTRTLVGRFLHLVMPQADGGLNADPSSVMMVTFTNKAAREMRERIDPVIEELRENNPNRVLGQPWIGTFHGLALRILRIEASRANLDKNFSILDDADTKSLAHHVADDAKRTTFDADLFFSDLEKVKSRMITPDILDRRAKEISNHFQDEGVKNDTALLPPALRPWNTLLNSIQTEGFCDLFKAYQNELTQQNSVDFADLLNHVTKILRDDPKTRMSWQSTFRHFMVDEVQDINRAQIGWISVLANGGEVTDVPEGVSENNFGDASHGLREVNTYRLRAFPKPTVAFVGDDDQAIYGFRGSDSSVMHSLTKRFANMETLFLRSSYRCSPAILDAANTLIKNNETRFDKTIRPADPERSSRPITVSQEMNLDTELDTLVSTLKQRQAAGEDLSETGILLRTRRLAHFIAEHLRDKNIPVQEGKGADIQKSAEVRDAMAYAGYIVNRDAETLLRRIINKPSRGLGPTSLSRVSGNAKLKNISFSEELRAIANDRVEKPEDGHDYTKAFVNNVKNFGTLINALRDDIKRCENASESLSQILVGSGYLPQIKRDALRAEGIEGNEEVINMSISDLLVHLFNESNKDKTNNPGKPLRDSDKISIAATLSVSARRLANLDVLMERAKEYESLNSFVQEAPLESDDAPSHHGVHVMTMHSSKGLEFDHVHLPFWVKGIMPHANAKNSPSAKEEERRLAYVCLTRARHSVAISFSGALGSHKSLGGTRVPSPISQSLFTKDDLNGVQPETLQRNHAKQNNMSGQHNGAGLLAKPGPQEHVQSSTDPEPSL